MLLILTVADIKAVGPGVFNGWKGQLLRTLYYETEPLLAGGFSQISREQRVEGAQQELAEALDGWSRDDIKAYLGRHYPAYWLRVDLDRKKRHAAFIHEADKAGKLLSTAVTCHDFEGVTEITVLAPDHPRVLSSIAGACTVAGADIVDAQVFTTTNGLAFDTILVRRKFDNDADEIRRGNRIREIIEGALTGAERLPEKMEPRLSDRNSRVEAFRIATDVLVNNSWSDHFTVIEVSGLDRPGLLYDLTREISDLKLDIGSAHVVTFGERAVDVFYVTDLTGGKIANGNRQAAIKRRLARAFDGKDASGDSKAAKDKAAA